MPEDLTSLISDILQDEDRDASPAEPRTFAEKYDAFTDAVRRHLEDMGTARLEQLQRDSEQRFSTSLPLATVHDMKIALVGAGGLGNHIWKILLGMGFKRLHVFDDDVVGVENIGPQMHRLVDLGLPKVEAVRREALAFRGVEVYAHNMRANSLNDIIEAVGGMPDVLIGATDSAEFRNGIILSFGETAAYRSLPLFLDLRMSLGDWNCFAFPVSAVLASGHWNKLYKKYCDEAVFPPEQAVHEPCTARAITYTGANVASYVGAFMHWWVTEGRDAVDRAPGYLALSFFSDDRMGKDFNWLYRCSSKEFMPETITQLQRVHNAAAGHYSVVSGAVDAYMRNLWQGWESGGCIGVHDVFEPSPAWETEACLNVDGKTHLYQAYNFEGDSMLVGIDINLADRTAEMAQRQYSGLETEDYNRGDIERKLYDDLAGCRVYRTFLRGRSAASYLLGRGWSNRFPLKSYDGKLPLMCALYAEDTDSSITLAVRLDPVGVGEGGRHMFKVRLFSSEPGMEGLWSLSPDELPAKLKIADGAKNMFSTGWQLADPANEKLLTFAVMYGSGKKFDMLLEGGHNRQMFDTLTASPESFADAVKIETVVDGTSVTVPGMEGEFEKTSVDGKPFLIVGGARVSAPAGMLVKVVTAS